MFVLGIACFATILLRRQTFDDKAYNLARIFLVACVGMGIILAASAVLTSTIDREELATLRKENEKLNKEIRLASPEVVRDQKGKLDILQKEFNQADKKLNKLRVLLGEIKVGFDNKTRLPIEQHLPDNQRASFDGTMKDLRSFINDAKEILKED